MFAFANYSAVGRKGAKQPQDPNSAEEKLRARLRRWLQHFEHESETLKRYELAKHMGISAAHLSNLLNGRAKIGIDAFVKMGKWGKSLEHMAMFEPPVSGAAQTPAPSPPATQDLSPPARKRAHGSKSGH